MTYRIRTVPCDEPHVHGTAVCKLFVRGSALQDEPYGQAVYALPDQG